MPYIRRFYYMPRVNDTNKETDVLTPCESLWKFEGTSLDPDPDKFTQGQYANKGTSFKDLPNEEQIKQLHFKKILGILNKMTPKKFHKLILQIGPETMDLSYVKMLAEIIFSKALVDEIYVHLYAKLCDEIIHTLSGENLESFKETIKLLCQSGFNHLLQLTDDDISAINEDKRFVFKRRFMTLMRFIGEMSCIKDALFNTSHNWVLTESLLDKGDELHLEAVYYLLFTCALRSNHNVWPERLWLTVARLSKGLSPTSCIVSSRIRFMYLSLVEARVGVLPQQQNPPQSSPTTSDSETNEQVAADFKGF